MPQLYIAAPLFSVAERQFNAHLRQMIDPFFQTYLPQEDGILLAETCAATRDSDTCDSVAESIFRADLAAIRQADVLLAVLDGRTVDEGTAFEIGFAYALGTPCYGLQTDPRRLLPQGNNPMISRSLRRVFADVEAVKAWAARYKDAQQ
jgi:nucleoside 2-deoxyribosyltransferase